jgi:hypothetical protein
MKNIYQNQHFANFRPAAWLSIFMMSLFMAIPVLMNGGNISGTFTPLTNCPAEMTGMCVDPATGILYARAMYSNAYYKYTISTGIWTALAGDISGSNWETGATLLNGKIYNSYEDLDDLGVYTIATDSWTTITGPTGGTRTATISNDGTNIYLVGGNGNSYFWKYVVASDSWVSLAANLSTSNAYGGLCYDNGWFYHSQGNGNDDFDRYNIATNSWEILPYIPKGSSGAVLGAATDGAYYYCAGGYDEYNLYSYALGEQVWNNTHTLPWPIGDASMCMYQGSLYIIQGEAGTGFTKFTPNNAMLTNMEAAALRYTIGAAATQITNTLAASQNSGTNFESAMVSVAGNFESGKDVLSFVNANGISGSWSSTTGVLTLTGSTTIANYQAALRTVKYYNSNATSSGLRRIEFKVYDGAIYSNIAVRYVAFPGPIVTTSPMIDITTNSANTGGVVTDDGGYAISMRGVCWNTTGKPTTADTQTSDGTGTGSFASPMTDLIDGTTYYVRAYATGSPAGKAPTVTTYGDEKVFVASDFYVNAGPDASTCGIDYYLSGVTGGAYSVDNTIWSTDGDGYFDDEFVLQTTYFAGMNDISTGFVTLTLTAAFTDPASSTVDDSMTLNFTISVGGAVTGETTVCSGTNSTLLTLEGSAGDVQKWQYSTNGTDWSDISAATTTTYTATDLTTATYYRALVKNGATCNVANSDPALVEVEETPVNGSLAKTPDLATVFDGTDVSAVLTPGSGGYGTDALLFQTKTAAVWSSWAEYTSGTAISTTGHTGVKIRTYRETSYCEPLEAVVAEWVVELKPTPGTIAASQTICYNTTPAAFTSTAGTGAGSISYEWQTNAGGTYADINGATDATYQAPALTATTSYQRRTVATLDGNNYYSDYTTPVTVTVQSTPTAGAIAADQTICYNTAPALLTSTTAGTGSGTITYEWQTNASGSYLTIGGATNATYQPPALTAATSYQRRTVSTLDGNICYSDYTTAVAITVQTTPTAGSIAENQTICNNTAPALLTSTTAGTGDGTISYEWQTNATGSYLTIAGATDATYQPPTLTATTSYMRRAVSTVGSSVCYSVYTTPVIITVQSVQIAGAIGSAQTICYNTTPAALTSLDTKKPDPSEISYEWQTNASGSYVTIEGATSATYQPPALTATTSYQRRTVSTINGNVCYSGYTTPVIITVQATPTAGVVAADQTICYNTAPALITSTTDGTGSGTISYQWFNANNEGVPWHPITGATQSTYQPPALTASGNAYRRITVSTLNGNVCSSDYTNLVEVTVQTTPTAGSIAASQTICYNSTPALLTSTTDGTGRGTISYEWQTNGSGSYVTIDGATDATYQPPALTATTSYQRRTVSTLNENICYSAYTTAVMITVDPASVGGTVGTSTHVCTGTNSTLLTLTGKIYGDQSDSHHRLPCGGQERHLSRSLLSCSNHHSRSGVQRRQYQRWCDCMLRHQQHVINLIRRNGHGGELAIHQ